MFYAYTFNVSNSCLRTNNNPIVYALDQAIAYNKTVLSTCPPTLCHEDCQVHFIRKEPCSSSWDRVCIDHGVLDIFHSLRFFSGSGFCIN